MEVPSDSAYELGSTRPQVEAAELLPLAIEISLAINIPSV